MWTRRALIVFLLGVFGCNRTEKCAEARLEAATAWEKSAMMLDEAYRYAEMVEDGRIFDDTVKVSSSTFLAAFQYAKSAMHASSSGSAVEARRNQDALTRLVDGDVDLLSQVNMLGDPFLPADAMWEACKGLDP